MCLIIEIPATSANLGPGFDTLGLAIDIKNRVKIIPSSIYSISISGEGEKDNRLKINNSFVNIFYEQYKNITGYRDNFRFEFQNNIPLSRGLGSSSAVIIGAITSAYEMANIKISKDKILQKALFYEHHADNISPATYGGFTVSLIKNSRVYVQKKPMPNYLKAVMVIPNKSMSTNHSRTLLPKYYKARDTIFNLSRSTALAVAFFREDWELLKIASEDKMHQNLRMKSLEELFLVQKISLKNGALMSTLSGSGSSFFNLVYSDDAKYLKKVLSDKFPSFRIEIVDFDNNGVVIS